MRASEIDLKFRLDETRHYLRFGEPVVELTFSRVTSKWMPEFTGDDGQTYEGETIHEVDSGAGSLTLDLTPEQAERYKVGGIFAFTADWWALELELT